MKRVAIALLLLAVCAGTAFAANPVRISQVYSGGGSSTTPVTYKQDYVELFNSSSNPVDMSGWTLAYASVTGTFSSTYAIPAGTVCMPCSYVLIGCGSLGSAGADFPVVKDLNCALNLAATAGKIALVSANFGSGTCPGGVVEDLVAWGAANCYESAALAVLSKTTGAVRNAGGMIDNDDNATDFAIVTNPIPRNSASPLNGECLVVPVEPSTWGTIKALYN